MKEQKYKKIIEWDKADLKLITLVSLSFVFMWIGYILREDIKTITFLSFAFIIGIILSYLSAKRKYHWKKTK